MRVERLNGGNVSVALDWVVVGWLVSSGGLLLVDVATPSGELTGVDRTGGLAERRGDVSPSGSVTSVLFKRVLFVTWTRPLLNCHWIGGDRGPMSLRVLKVDSILT